MLKLHRSHFIFTFVALTLAVTAGCSGGGAAPAAGGNAAATDIPAVQSSGEVVAEGKVVPVQYTNLSFSKGGVVAEVLIKEGAVVKKGDLIGRLEDSETLKSSVAQAEEALLLAQQKINDLKDDANVDAAKTFSTISASYDSLREADRQLYYFNLPVNQRNLDMFKASDLMQQQLDKARKAWDPYKYEDAWNGALNERTTLKKDLDNAESDYRTSLLRISYAAKAEAAKADLAKARKDYESLQNGPDPDKMAAAEAGLKNAEAALAASQAALEDLELKAPFDGTVAKLDLKVGENVNPGVTVVSLADFSSMIIETDNLTEIEVVKVAPGQAVSVVADALPEDVMEGKVTHISEVFEEKRGDVTYTVKISLAKVPEKLRWGMTVNATFKTQ